MPLQKDWQTSCHSIQGRIEYMFKMGESSDCQFMVGSEPNHQIFHGHKFIFAMTSPVFNTMFNGSLQEKDEVIQILDVQPTTFQTLLEYIYLDKINVKSAEEAFQLGYVAKKYMLPYVYDCCVKFLENNVCCENACKIYEFALLFEENRLAASSFELICAQTERILKLPNFEETSLTTFQVIFDQNSLNITNELTLFLALARFADKYEDRYTKKNGKDEDDRLNDSLDLPSSRPPIEDVKPVQGIPDHSHIIDAVKKIRFLCFTPQQFADNVPQTNPNCSLCGQLIWKVRIFGESELLSIGMDPPQIDWQTSCYSVKRRIEYMFKTGQWSDCQFMVGSEPNRQLFHGHKLILAMASPVFDTMFNGGLPEGDGPIQILDVQPTIFRALLEYIYLDKINVESMEEAFQLGYVAKKYMFPYVLRCCIDFLRNDLCCKNVCKIYEFAVLFEEDRLAEKCSEIIREKTENILTLPSFEEISLTTFQMILDQESLNIENELVLFLALARLADKYEYRNKNIKDEDDRLNDPCEGPSSRPPIQDMKPIQRIPTRSQFIEAVKKIRFLSLTPKQFAENVPQTNLLNESESFAILMNISSQSHSIYPMPDGFSTSARQRRRDFLTTKGGISDQSDMDMDPIRSKKGFVEYRKFYCVRSIQQQSKYFNENLTECSLTFTVDRAICINGIQIPTQVLGDQLSTTDLPESYTELLYTQLADFQGVRLTYTHCSPRVRYGSLLEMSFDRPVFIQHSKLYKIDVAYNKAGWYPMCTYNTSISNDRICFTFNVGDPNDTKRDGLIRGIVFSLPPKSLYSAC